MINPIIQIKCETRFYILKGPDMGIKGHKVFNERTLNKKRANELPAARGICIWITRSKILLLFRLDNYLNESKTLNFKNYFLWKICYLEPELGAKGICEIVSAQNVFNLLITLEINDFFKNINLIKVSNIAC